MDLDFTAAVDAGAKAFVELIASPPVEAPEGWSVWDNTLAAQQLRFREYALAVIQAARPHLQDEEVKWLQGLLQQACDGLRGQDAGNEAARILGEAGML